MKKFIKYVIVGGGTFLLDIGLLYLFVEFFNIYYLYSATLALIIATYANYHLNKVWSFDSQTKLITSFSKYLLLFIFNYFVTIILMYTFVEYLNFNYLVIKCLAMVLLVIWNFFAYRFYVYK